METTRIPEDASDFSGQRVFESIKKALRDGCDVEVVFHIPDKRSGHAVTVVGFADFELGNAPYRTLVVHDPYTNSYDDLYEIKEDSKTLENFPFEGALHTVQIAFAVKECYKPPQTACADFSGTYTMLITQMDDPGGHYQFVGNPFQQPVVFVITDPSITATGQPPFVGVSGTIDSQCSFTAQGAGTVAGYPNVTVKMQASFSNESVDGSYTMGAGGELPGGKAITFHFSGTKQ